MHNIKCVVNFTIFVVVIFIKISLTPPDKITQQFQIIVKLVTICQIENLIEQMHIVNSVLELTTF